jgi:hypothetical protein
MKHIKENPTPQQNEAGRYGYINADNEIVIPFEYDDIFVYDYTEKIFFRVEKDGKFGIIDVTGKLILPVEYETIGASYYIDSNDDKIFFTAKKDNKFGFFNSDGIMILPSIYDNMSPHFTDETDFLEVHKDKKWGVIGSDGEIIIPFEYDWLKFAKKYFSTAKNTEDTAVVICPNEETQR